MTAATFWYPTTLSGARQMFHEGLKPEEHSSEVADVCRAFDVEGDAVRQVLRRWRHSSRPDRHDTSALLLDDRQSAVCLAQQQPRQRWDALWAVWCVHNGISPDRPPLREPDARAWHTDQLLADPPAIVQVQVEDEAANERWPAAAIGWCGSSNQNGSETVPVARVELPVDSAQIVARYTIPRWISVHAAAGMTGRSVTELRELVERGELTPPRDPGRPLGDPYWTIDDMFGLLDA